MCEEPHLVNSKCSVNDNYHYEDYYLSWCPSSSSVLPSVGHSLVTFPCIFFLPRPLCLLPTIPSTLAPLSNRCLPPTPSHMAQILPLQYSVSFGICGFSEGTFFSHFELFFSESHCPLLLTWKHSLLFAPQVVFS